MKRGNRAIPERLLARLWQERAHRLTRLRTLEGRTIRVLFPGRPGRGPGPDFRDALVLDAELGLVRGDVEVHTSPRGWQAHGHHRDRRYSGVVLHLVGRPGASPAGVPYTVEADALKAQASGPHPGAWLWSVLYRLGYRPPATAEGWGAFLARAGVQRLRLRVRRMRTEIERHGADQAVYEAVAKALGYSRNRHPFRLLAQALPWREVARLAGERPQGERRAFLEALFEEASGLGFRRRLLPQPLVPSGLWRTAGVRPCNHPRRRVRALALLCHRFLGAGGPARFLADACLAGRRSLGEALRLRDERGKALVGKDRAGDIAVNAVLPFLCALGCARKDRSLCATAVALLTQWPALQENEVTREMRGLLIPPAGQGRTRRAVHQQGLLHLHRLIIGERG